MCFQEAYWGTHCHTVLPFNWSSKDFDPSNGRRGKKKQPFFQEWFLIMFLIRGKKKKLTQKLRLWIVTERKPGAKFTFLLLLHSSYNLDSFHTYGAFCCANAACEMQNIKLSMLRTWRCSEWEKFKAQFTKPLPPFHPASPITEDANATYSARVLIEGTFISGRRHS